MMAGIGSERWGSKLIGIIVIAFLVMASIYVVAKGSFEQKASSYQATEQVELHYVSKSSNSQGQLGRVGHVHVWPKMKFGWKIVVGGIIGFLGAAFGSVGGVGGGGIFVPMLTLIIGFDQKSSTAISKCKYPQPWFHSAWIYSSHWNKVFPRLIIKILDIRWALTQELST